MSSPDPGDDLPMHARGQLLESLLARIHGQGGRSTLRSRCQPILQREFDTEHHHGCGYSNTADAIYMEAAATEGTEACLDKHLHLGGLVGTL